MRNTKICRENCGDSKISPPCPCDGMSMYSTSDEPIAFLRESANRLAWVYGIYGSASPYIIKNGGVWGVMNCWGDSVEGCWDADTSESCGG